ncbi:MAG: T9SS type A sorting domain-containing protein, partial [Bacteroidota bacterium]
FYYENDSDLSPDEIATIKGTRMVDIVLNNTDLDIMQENIFIAMPHEMLCTAPNSQETVEGTVALESGLTLEGIEIDVEVDGLGLNVGSQVTGPGGIFSIGDIETCDGYNVIPTFEGVADDGVTTMDIVLLQRHILGIEPLTTPYQLIAGDANNSGTITTLDIVDIRKVILQISPAFTNNTNWRFVDAAYTFQNPDNPFAESFPESVHIPNLTVLTNASFVAIKVGDLNASSLGNSLLGSEQRSNDELLFTAVDQAYKAGDIIELRLSAEELEKFVAFQFTLNYDLTQLEWLGAKENATLNFAAKNYFSMPEAGAVTIAWTQSPEAEAPNEKWIDLRFRALETGAHLLDVVSLNGRYTKALAYREDFAATAVQLAFSQNGDLVNVEDRYELYQNIPNPVINTTEIGFYLPNASQGTIRILDVNGREVYTVNQSFDQGLNTWILDRSMLNVAGGVYFYELRTDFGTISRSMAIVR